MYSTPSTNDPYAGFGGQFGYYTDFETGLQLCTFRYYDSANGRWLTRDPIGYSGGVNLYGYVGNNPVNFMDFWGLVKTKIGAVTFDISDDFDTDNAKGTQQIITMLKKIFLTKRGKEILKKPRTNLVKIKKWEYGQPIDACYNFS